MTTHSRGARLVAPTVAMLLAAGALAGLASPASAVRTSFANNGGVAIADPISGLGGAITINDDTVATPYPSTINIAESGIITDVNVAFSDYTHAYLDDVDVLLVGPEGQQVTLMSDIGGGNAAVDVDLTFNDESPNLLPDNAPISSGSYKPTNFGGTDDFPATAPIDSGNTLLSTFDGTQAQGAWRLFVVDDIGGQVGDIESWRLDISVKSTPYPSTINVSGLGTKVSDVNVSLTGLSHTYPDNIDVLLVGPGGQQATVMSDSGGTTDLVAVDLVLDDEALAPLSNAGPIVTGTYQPLNSGLNDEFPPPAPLDTGGSALSVFDGSNPNGTWSLYIADDLAANQGTLVGWSLDIETDNTPPTGTVAINGGGTATTSSAVTLSVAASDPGTPTSGLSEMRFSNDGVTFSAFQPYAATAAWTLASGDGTKTVFAQFRDASGIDSAVVSDTIVLDTTGPKAKKLNPKNNAKAVKVTAKVKVVASEKLTPGSVTKTTVFLKQKGTPGKIKAKVSYVSSTTTIVLTPKESLKSGKTYKVTVKGVKDLLGLTWDQKPGTSGAQPLKFTFTTA